MSSGSLTIGGIDANYGNNFYSGGNLSSLKFYH
jgi:hypothetical protein